MIRVNRGHSISLERLSFTFKLSATYALVFAALITFIPAVTMAAVSAVVDTPIGAAGLFVVVFGLSFLSILGLGIILSVFDTWLGVVVAGVIFLTGLVFGLFTLDLAAAAALSFAITPQERKP